MVANVDRPNGFHFVKTISGAPVAGMIRSLGVTDGADLFIGDAVSITSGLVARAAVEDAIAGVIVGFGKKNSMTGSNPQSFNPDALITRWYDDSANTHTDWVAFYIPAEDAIFEAQTDGTTELVVGEAQDITVTAGSATTGLSGMEINDDALTNDGDVVVVEKPVKPDNDFSEANARYWVKFVNTTFNNA